MFHVLQGGESDQRSIVIVVSSLTSLMMEQREMEQTSLQHMKSVDELQQDLDTMENIKGGKSALY